MVLIKIIIIILVVVRNFFRSIYYREFKIIIKSVSIGIFNQIRGYRGFAHGGVWRLKTSTHILIQFFNIMVCLNRISFSICISICSNFFGNFFKRGTIGGVYIELFKVLYKSYISLNKALIKPYNTI